MLPIYYNKFSKGCGGSSKGVDKTEFYRHEQNWSNRMILVDSLQVNDFEVEVGAMDYGFAIDGIIGTDFLLQVGAVIDLPRLEIRCASP